MARTGVGKTKLLMLREKVKQVERNFSRIAGAEKARLLGSIKSGGVENSSCWVPHPRSGIYVPKGQEWVMNDVPEGAACFDRTYWLRNVDGVEKPDPEMPSDEYLTTKTLA